MNTTNQNAIALTATAVPENKRMAFMPGHFGMACVIVESTIFAYMRKLATDYNGGYWEFYQLSNGGLFIAPSDEKLTISVDGNGYEGEMSGEAAGITACLFAFGELANRTQKDHYIEKYWNLREYAREHKEASAILRAID